MSNTQSNPVRTVLVGLRFGASLANRKIFCTTENDAFIKIVGVCDRDHAKADAYAALHGNLPVYYDLEDVLKVDDVEAIMLMIPPAGRAEAVRKCLQAGKHVLTTKPFESDPDAALKVLREKPRKITPLGIITREQYRLIPKSIEIIVEIRVYLGLNIGILRIELIVLRILSL